jgi:multidrug efflux pump subunit AcrA (membrane-fusion protein)
MSAIGNQAPLPVEKPEKIAPPSSSPEPKKSKLWKWLILLVIIAAPLATYQFWVKPRRAQQEAAKTTVTVRTAKVTRGSMVRTVRISGQTSARNYANIIAPILRSPEGNRGQLLMKLAKSGSYVKKGDLLAEIDSQSVKDHIEDVVDMVKQAENDIEKRKAQQAVEMESLLQSLRIAKADFDKWTLEAGASEIRTPIDQEVIKLQAEESQARYKEQLTDVETKKISHAADLQIAGIALIRQRRHLERHQIDLKATTIRSPMDGLAVMQSVFRGSEMGQIQEGDQVTPGQSFMKVVNQNSMQLDASVNQAQSGDFRVGLAATIGFDAFPGLTFKGKIYSIGALAAAGWRSSLFIRSVPVRLAIESSDPRVIPDLSSYADVQMEKQENTLLAPLGALHSRNGRSYVSVKTPAGFEERQVEVGLANNLQAAIKSGLDEGAEVKID